LTISRGKLSALNRLGGKTKTHVDRLLLVISVPKVFVNGQFCFNLSSKTWSLFFWNTV